MTDRKRGRQRDASGARFNGHGRTLNDLLPQRPLLLAPRLARKPRLKLPRKRVAARRKRSRRNSLIVVVESAAQRP